MREHERGRGEPSQQQPDDGDQTDDCLAAGRHHEVCQQDQESERKQPEFRRQRPEIGLKIRDIHQNYLTIPTSVVIAALITSSSGLGYNPKITISTASGTSEIFSRVSRSGIPAHRSLNGPRKMRWIAHKNIAAVKTTPVTPTTVR